jgi:HK97 family phage major capsid protein
MTQPPPVGPIDASGLIPTTYVNQVFQQAATTSAVLTLGRKLPIPTGKTSIPIPASFPVAGFVTAPGGRKPWTDFRIETQEIIAEEIAATIAIPDSYVEDSSINLWAYARPLLAEAIATTLDAAVFAGTGAPASYPQGGIEAFGQEADAGIDAIDTVNNAMGLVEAEGLPVTGSAADLRVKSVLRGVRDNTGALLLDTQQVQGNAVNQLYGVPIAWNSYMSPDFDFITGDWACLVVGVRQDIRYETSNSGVLTDANGKVLVSAFQDNQTLMKIWARIGVAILQPVTPYTTPDGAKPFAYAQLAGTSAARSLSVGAAPAAKSSK